ncbi:MAG TPA: flagellar hook-associated protein FlgK [Bacillota bacterium]|nr:flagellar hook-associated protein FlgK [Clostridiales bacterium]HPT85450.1 flagellar hook-associated protein FlgK [Bacillota bacterium]
MRPTFSGFEIVKSGIQSAQVGLDVTGKNVANMGAEGYSRQVVDQKAIYYSSSTYKYAPVGSQRLGQGVTVDQIVQIRDKFLDIRFRAANSEYAEFAKKTEVLEHINDILDETTADGLGVLLEELFERLQALSTNSGKIEFASLVRSSAQKITETVQFYYNKLEEISALEKENLETITLVNLNKYLDEIAKLNKTIQNEELVGNTPNDLYDARNLLLDKVSKYLKIEVGEYPDDSPYKGALSVKCGNIMLVDPAQSDPVTLSLREEDGKLKIYAGDEELDLITGEIKGTLDILNGEGSFAEVEEFKGIPYYLKSLDSFAVKFAEVFNSLNGGDALFVGTGAKDFAISDGWLADANYLKVTTEGNQDSGKNDNVLRMIHALEQKHEITEKFVGSLSEFVLILMSDAAIDKNYYTDRASAADTVVSAIDNQRESVKGVSLNEETVNMIKYQRAFEASARVMTALDEMLDIIINRMGIVGR